jgi:hypothetical protein
VREEAFNCNFFAVLERLDKIFEQVIIALATYCTTTDKKAALKR